MAVLANMPEPWFVGEDRVLVFTVVDDAGVAITDDIAAWTFLFHVKRRPRDLAAVVEKATGGLGVVVDNTAKTATVTIADTDTDALAAGLYHWALWRTNEGSEAALAVGTLELRDTARDVIPPP